MSMITLRQLLDHAAEYGYGVPAFNINNMEQIRAIMLAARVITGRASPSTVTWMVNGLPSGMYHLSPRLL